MYNQIRAGEAKVSINEISKNKIITQVSKETKVLTVEDHLKKTNPKIREIFQKYREAILNLDDRIIEKPVSWYIGYKVRFYNFVSLCLSKNNIRILIRSKKIKDPKGLFKRIPESYGWGKTPIWQAYVNSLENFDYIIGIIKQSYLQAPDR